MSREGALRLLLLLVVATTLITPWRRELFVGDETKYAQVIREMRGGAFFLPTLGGEPFTHKPPLHFWLVDALTVPLGVYSMWAFVLPSILAFILLLWIVWRMEGLTAAFVCGTALMVWGSAQTARMDVGFTALLAAAALMLRRFFDEDDFRALLAAGVLTGLATLLKGPMAPVIAICLFVFEWVRTKDRPRGNYAWAVLAMVVIPLLWFVPAMLMGGEHYTHEVLVKQTAGRAIGAWVHRSPPWFYVVRSPATLFPWFLPAVVAVVAAWKRNDERAKFYVSWILAVIVPYSLLSSKLDIYMMTMIPPAALLIGRLVDRDEPDRCDRLARAANAVTMALMLAMGIAALVMGGRLVKGPDGALVQRTSVRMLFVVLAVSAATALVITARSRKAITSTVLAGLVPLAALTYAAASLMPLANELGSTRPLIAAIEKQRVPPENVALYWSPYLWARDMPRELEHVQYVSPESLAKTSPPVIVTSRQRAADIAGSLRGMHVVDSFRMIGKWFDVYRR